MIGYHLQVFTSEIKLKEKKLTATPERKNEKAERYSFYFILFLILVILPFVNEAVSNGDRFF